MAKKQSAAMPMSESEHHSMSCRKISNGYIVSRSSHDGKGNYKSEEMYMPKKPKIEMPSMEKNALMKAAGSSKAK